MNARDETYLKMRNFVYKEQIGAGGNGVVYRIYDPNYDCDFALKSVFESKFNKNEIDCMKQVDDPNVVRLYGYEYFEGSVYLLMEYCPTSLGQYLRKHKNLCSDTVKKYAIGVLKAIRACHRFNIAHLDIKPGNFLIDQYDRVRVCDFGLSANLSGIEKEQQFAGSVPYMAPEIACHNVYDPKKADMWSVGVTLYMLATGRLPWTGKDRNQLSQNAMTKDPQLEYVQDELLATAIKSCLDLDPELRPTVDELLELPIFRENSLTCIKKQSLVAKPRAILSQTSLIIKPKLCRSSRCSIHM